MCYTFLFVNFSLVYMTDCVTVCVLSDAASGEVHCGLKLYAARARVSVID
jgi:hypothetical protein